ncbi:VOC family protein [Saccharothrix obliqua]|uniref:VOC family protein n=1 Tax=Saccharothrix obliqua TaxID=2861747 RepID=UPI0027E24551|nr:VOC family protein [Saccharothrix obliqua]
MRKLTATVLDAPDPQALARFYRDLLDWELDTDEPDWASVRPAPGEVGLSFQAEPGFEPPTWPRAPGRQQMMAHLDIEVDDLVAESRRAEELGATAAEFQPQRHVRVFLDPVGHPFCLWVRG